MTPEQKDILKQHIANLTLFFIKGGYDVRPLPVVMFSYANSADDILAPTGHYNSLNNTITLYCNGRHMKDVLNTFSHELVHRWQDVQGRLDPSLLGQSDSYTKGSDYLKEIEAEAYVLGNTMRRVYTENLQ